MIDISYLYYLLSISSISLAQDNPLHEPLSTLELDSISTGFLADHTFSWGGMLLYDGSYQDTLPNNKMNWLQLHLDLERSKVNSNAGIGSYGDMDSLGQSLMEASGNTR